MDRPARLTKLYENIGRQIRAARTERGITLEELADKVGRNWSYLSQIERARGIPSIETLFIICEELHIPLASLFETHQPREIYEPDACEHKIAYILREAPPKEKKEAVMILKKLFRRRAAK